MEVVPRRIRREAYCAWIRSQNTPRAGRNRQPLNGVSLVDPILSGEASLDEQILIRRILGGDTAAWEPLILMHQEAVFRLVYLFLGDADEAADISQETFLRAWRHLAGFDENRKLRPWLLSISANLARNRTRSTTRYLDSLLRAHKRDVLPTPGTEEKSLRRMQAAELWQAVRNLKYAEQQIVYLRIFLDLSVEETAEVMQIATGTVKSRLSRALKKLRSIIQRNFPALMEGRDS